MSGERNGHPNLLDAAQAALVVIDVQEAFRAVIPDFAIVASRISTAVQGCRLLNVPVIVTEQYPKGLGHTAEEIDLVLGDDAKSFEKTAFSAGGCTPFIDELRGQGIRQVIVCGLETHICVCQTAHGLLDDGFQVQVLVDAVCSRFEHDRIAGIDKMRAGGALPSTVEMALFELMRDSRHPKFKEIQSLIK